MTAVAAIIGATVRNVLGIKRLAGFGLLALGPSLILLLVVQSASQRGRIEAYTSLVFGLFLGIVVPIVTIVIAGSVLGAERRGGTLSFLMLRPLSRYVIAASKLASAIAASLVINGAAALVMGGIATVYLGDIGYLTSLLVGVIIATIGYAAIYMPLGYFTERATLIGFAYIFIWELGISTAVTGVAGTSVWKIAATGMVAIAPELDRSIVNGFLGDLVPGVGGAFAKVLVLAAVSILITGWTLRVRDLT